MNRTAFYGTIYSGDFEVIKRILEKWLGPEVLDVKIRLSGEEITYETEEFYLYCYNAIGSEGVTPYYLLEGNTTVGLDETRHRLENLLSLCKAENLAATFEYVEVNDAGEEVSEEFRLS
jgi:hypothetical protein